MRIKKDDKVVVRSGKDRNETGTVLSVDREKSLVTVDGVNEVFRHVRRSQKNVQGGRHSKFMPIPVGNVMLVCQKCQKPTRVGIQVDENGKKHRMCKKCKSLID